MGSQAIFRAHQREERRQYREAARRQKDLERQVKEQAKLSASEQAQLEVSTFENQLELLVSIHKEQGPAWDWAAVAALLPPAPPQRLPWKELRVRQQLCLSGLSKQPSPPELISQAQLLDDREYAQALASYEAEVTNLEQLKALASRVLAGELKAYTEALTQFSPLSELSVLGSTLHFTVHDTSLIECVINAADQGVIPAEIKCLTSAGKLSVKAMPRTRLHELYQDHICSCILRVAREIFALLPVETLLVTASAKNTGNPHRHRIEPVLSAIFPRKRLLELDFEGIDPSDAIEGFIHRGDFKASRKTGAFASIVAFTAADCAPVRCKKAEMAELLKQVRTLRKTIREALASFPTPGISPEALSSQPP